MSATGKDGLAPAEEAGEAQLRAIVRGGDYVCFGLGHMENKVRQPPEKTNIILAHAPEPCLGRLRLLKITLQGNGWRASLAMLLSRECGTPLSSHRQILFRSHAFSGKT